MYNQRAMSDNVTARKKLENIEKARKADEIRREKIKAQRLRGVDTSDGVYLIKICCKFDY